MSLLLMGAGAAGTVNILTGLVAAWLESPGSSVTADSSGNGHTLTNNGGVGNSGGFATFNGTNQWLSLADASAFPTSDDTDFTVACEFTFSAAAAQTLLAKGGTSSGWLAQVSSGKSGRQGAFQAGGGGGTGLVTFGTALSTSTTYKYVARMYATGGGTWARDISINDGAFVTSSNSSHNTADAADALKIGADLAGAVFLGGSMRRARFWGRKLTDAECLVCTEPL